MANHTDDTTGCEREVVFAMDVLDTNRSLLTQHIPLSDNLASCGYGPQKCGFLRGWINMRRAAAGKAPLPGGAIKPTTTMRQAIDHVCA